MDNNNTPTQTAARPGMLTVLCILSMIFNGLLLIFCLIGIFALAAISGMFPGLLSGLLPSSPLYAILSVVLCAITFYGVIQMWKLKKMGFYMYAGAQVAGVVISTMQTGFSIAATIFCAVWIALYYMNLKHMS